MKIKSLLLIISIFLFLGLSLFGVDNVSASGGPATNQTGKTTLTADTLTPEQKAAADRAGVSYDDYADVYNNTAPGYDGSTGFNGEQTNNFSTGAGGTSGNNNTLSSGGTGGMGIRNPLKWDDLSGAFTGFMGEIKLVAGIIAVLAFIWVGWLYVRAMGDPKKITEAHKAFMYVAIGVGILLGAEIIATIIKNTISNIQV